MVVSERWLAILNLRANKITVFIPHCIKLHWFILHLGSFSYAWFCDSGNTSPLSYADLSTAAICQWSNIKMHVITGIANLTRMSLRVENLSVCQARCEFSKIPIFTWIFKYYWQQMLSVVVLEEIDSTSFWENVGKTPSPNNNNASDSHPVK